MRWYFLGSGGNSRGGWGVPIYLLSNEAEGLFPKSQSHTLLPGNRRLQQLRPAKYEHLH
jgi:hypothetical protein